MGSPPPTVWGLMKPLCEFHDLITFPAVLAPNRAVMGRGTLLASPVIVGAARKLCISCRHCPSLGASCRSQTGWRDTRAGTPHKDLYPLVLGTMLPCAQMGTWDAGRDELGPSDGVFQTHEVWTKNHDP